MSGYESVPSLAYALCRIAARLLPAAHRGRYEEEWAADLAATDRDKALAYGLSVFWHALHLRLTLAGRLRTETPWRCRLHLHAYVTVHDNPDDRRFTSHVCTRCGHIKDDWRGPNRVNDSMAWASSSSISHA